MRVSALTAGLFLTSAILTVLAAGPVLAASGHQTKVTCLCDCCPDKAKAKVVSRPPVRRVVRRSVRHRAAHYGGGYYAYGQAAVVGPIYRREWHGQWQVAPGGAFIPGPAPVMVPGPMAYYAPPMPAPAPDMPIDDRGFTGGVGYGADGGGGGGGFMDGFGQLHFGVGGSVENGPTYNSYGQSFQYNPSQAGPFRARRMGGFAPPPAAK